MFPIFLYLSTFSWVSSCGEGFLQCARFMNVLFLVASLLPLYRTARLFMHRTLAVVIAAFAIAAPVHTYTAYFMAETMYFFLFWIFVWFVLSHLRGNPLQLGSGIGAIGALLTLVKPHGLVLLGAATVFVLVLAIVCRRTYPLRWLSKVLIAVALSFPVLRFGLGYILAGRAGFDLLGAYRGQVAPMANLAALPSQLAKVLHVAWGHMAGLIFLFSVPIAICVSHLPRLARPEPERSSGADLAELSLFTIVLFGVFVAFFSKFTVDIAGKGPYETLTRLHARYYDFALPLFLIITAAFMESVQPAFVPRLRSRVIVVVVLVAGIVGSVFSLRAFTPVFIDDPELAWVAVSPRLLVLLGAAAVVLV
jgi:phosphoglycerol transferase